MAAGAFRRSAATPLATTMPKPASDHAKGNARHRAIPSRPQAKPKHRPYKLISRIIHESFHEILYLAFTHFFFTNTEEVEDVPS
jgi:hypothetical protein